MQAGRAPVGAQSESSRLAAGRWLGERGTADRRRAHRAPAGAPLDRAGRRVPPARRSRGGTSSRSRCPHRADDERDHLLCRRASSRCPCRRCACRAGTYDTPLAVIETPPPSGSPRRSIRADAGRAAGQRAGDHDVHEAARVGRLPRSVPRSSTRKRRRQRTGRRSCAPRRGHRVRARASSVVGVPARFAHPCRAGPARNQTTIASGTTSARCRRRRAIRGARAVGHEPDAREHGDRRRRRREPRPAHQHEAGAGIAAGAERSGRAATGQRGVREPVDRAPEPMADRARSRLVTTRASRRSKRPLPRPSQTGR